MQESTRDVVLVAGASGFVGRALGPLLAHTHRPVGLSRKDRPGSNGYERFVQCDLLSLEDTERALQGARYAIYLVHSMMPASRLTQASFDDLDLICADNFARAARKAGVERIVYLGGLMTDEKAALSDHLQSRLDVERVLGSTGVPVTVLRAGLVLGAEGSSYQILSRLVRRLPVMICPTWTHTRTQAVALADVVKLLAFATTDKASSGRVFDVAAPEVVSYQEIMRRFAEKAGKKRYFLGVPLFSPGLSRLWLSLITGAPRALAGPLVESLRHEMTARNGASLAEAAGLTPTSFDDALAASIQEEDALRGQAFAFAVADASAPAGPSTVTSVQRMKLPKGRDATWAASEYPRWLSRTLGLLLHVVKGEDDSVEFRLRLLGITLLRLSPVAGRSSADRFLYQVSGGMLARPGQKGTFELRQVMGNGTLLTIVRDFEPRLPWWIYRATQAVAHAWIMHAFGNAIRSAPAQ
jgi:uncharacterized protein YbjT (DUF2867 family)